MRSDRGIPTFRSVRHAELFTSLELTNIHDPTQKQHVLKQRRDVKLQTAADYLKGGPDFNPNPSKALQIAAETTGTVTRPNLFTKENMYWLWASFSTYRLFILRLMHFLKSIGKLLIFRFFSVLSLSYFGEIAYYGYHLCKESKNAMPIADVSLQGWQWLKNRFSTFFTCCRNAWNENPQRRYKMINAIIWSAVNLCTYLLPAGFIAVAIINLIGFTGDVINEITRRSDDVKMAEELEEDLGDAHPLKESVEKCAKDAKNKRKLEVTITAVLLTCMAFYFFPFVNIALIAATAIILLVSSFFVLRNLWNLNKSIVHHRRQNEIELPTCDNKASHFKTAVSPILSPIPTPTATSPAPITSSSTASVMTCTENSDELTKLPLTRQAVSAPILFPSSVKEVIIIKSKSEGDLINLPEIMELEVIEKWLERIKNIIQENGTDNLMVILQNLTLKETNELRTVLDLKSHQQWRRRLKDWIKISKKNEGNNGYIRLFCPYTLLGALEAQKQKITSRIETLKKATYSDSNSIRHVSSN